MLLYFAMTENTLRKSIPSFPLSASAALTSRPGAPRGGSYTPATRKAPKCRLRRMKRGGFEEVSRLPRRNSGREAADTTVSAEECAPKITTRMGGDFWSGRRGSNAALPRRDTHTGTKTCPRHVFLAALVPFRASSRGALFQKETPSFRMVFLFGAGDEARTRYLDLGKVALYQMSYARKRRRCCGTLVPPVGVEPTTRGFSVRCSTN